MALRWPFRAKPWNGHLTYDHRDVAECPRERARYVVRLDHVDAAGKTLHTGTPRFFPDAGRAERAQRRMQSDNRWYTDNRFPLAVIEPLRPDPRLTGPT